ncbi:MAG: pyridoxal phosphate-dependent aminotransferase, partial [Candidatus Muirbacterium halophilum]|nr:pyridoxal phosphate-dependent aminotransferase [Candidatus Muirbacterium halophilum]
MRPSSRVLEMQESPIRKLVPYSDRLIKSGKSVYHLNIGQPDIETPQCFWDAIHKFEKKVLSYAHSQGLTEYHESTIDYYKNIGIDFDKDELIITNGGSEAIYFAMLACLELGQEIIVFEPFYTNYNSFAGMAGVKLVPVTTYAENGFDLPKMADIEKLITKKTKAIMICNPNNPTGTVYSREKMKELASLVKKHNLFLFSDEVYREFVYDGQEHVSVMEFPEISQNAILLDSISKRYSACGARVGSVASKNKDIMKNIMKLAQARLCAPTLAQVGATALNREIGDDYFIEMRKEYQERRDIVMEYLKKDPEIICLTPGGAFYIIAKIPVKDSTEFATWMLRDFSVNNETTMVAPANGFYATP